MTLAGLCRELLVRARLCMHLVSSDGDAVLQRIFLQSFSNHWEHLISYTLVLGDGGGGGGGGGGAYYYCS